MWPNQPPEGPGGRELFPRQPPVEMKARLGPGLAHTTAKRHQAFAASKPLGSLVTLFLKLFVFLKWPLRREQAETRGEEEPGTLSTLGLPARLQGAFQLPAQAQSFLLLGKSLHPVDQMGKLRPRLVGKSLLLQGSLPGGGLRHLNPPNSREKNTSLWGAEQKASAAWLGALSGGTSV